MSLSHAVDRPPTVTSEPIAAPVGMARTGRLLAWVGIVILALYMTVGEGSGWYGVYSAVLRLFSVASLAVVFATWGLVAWRDPAWRPRSVLWLPIVAGLGAYAVGTVASWNPRISLEYTAYAVLLAGLYLLLVRLVASTFFQSRLYTFAALLCAGICLWYVWTVAGLWTEWWGLVGRIATPPLRPAMDGLSWRSPNTVAIMVILLLPPVLACFWGGSRRRRVLLAALTLLTLVTVVLTGSRGAWLGLGVALLGTAVVWLAVPGHAGALRARLARLGRVPLLILGVLGVGAVAVAVPLVASRIGGGGEDLRADLVANAIRVFQTDALTGSGPGTWVVRRIAFTDPSEQDYYIPHAHNIFAQTAAEYGVIGLVSGAIVVVWLLALIWQAARGDNPVRRRFAWASLFATIYLGVHQLVDLYVGLPCVLFALALSVGYLDATSSRSILRGRWAVAAPPGPFRVARSAAVAVLCAGIVGSITFLAWSESAALAAEDAVGSANAGDWAAALRSAETARARDPDMPAYAFIVGLAALHTGDAQLAADSLAVSTAADDFPEAWLDLAVARLELGDTAAARAALGEAMRLGRQQPSVAFGAGTMYQGLGDAADATDAFVAAISGAPTLATDPYFATGGPAAGDAVEAGIRAQWAPTAWDSALLVGDAVDAQSRAERLEGRARDQALMIIRAWNGDAAARADLAAAARSAPTDAGLVGWTARVERHAGDQAASDRYRRWGSIVTPGGGDLALDVRTVSGVGSQHGFGGVDPNVYGLYAYRRPMPIDLLAPTILHLETR